MGGSHSSDLAMFLSMVFSAVALISLVAAVVVHRMEHRSEMEWNEYLDDHYADWRMSDDE